MAGLAPLDPPMSRDQGQGHYGSEGQNNCFEVCYRSKVGGSDDNEIDYNSLNTQFSTIYCIFSETLGLNKRLDLGDDPDQDQEFFRNFSKFQNRSFSAICALRTHL